MPADLAPYIDRIQSASGRAEPLRIVGGDSLAFYGNPSTGDALRTDGLAGVLTYEPTELVLTVGTGTPLSEVEALLATQGQCLPFEPPHFGPKATVGGMVAAGLSGPSRASVGSVRDHVLGLHLINGRGELLQFGGQVMKNVAGYDVSRLMAGAMGTLGLLTQVSLKVLPVAPAEATLVFELDQASALAQLQTWGGQPLPLNASCWVHDDTGTSPRDLLFVRLRGAAAAVEAACARLLRDRPGQRMDNTQAAPDWTDCREQRLPFFHPPAPGLALWRLSVAPHAAPFDLPWPQLIEWHGALRWLWAPPEAAARLRQAAVDAHGHATLFRAPQTDAPELLPRFAPVSAPLAAIQRRLKAEFDPAGIFNPGRLGTL